jgi:hypothetical protein
MYGDKMTNSTCLFIQCSTTTTTTFSGNYREPNTLKPIKESKDKGLTHKKYLELTQSR